MANESHEATDRHNFSLIHTHGGNQLTLTDLIKATI